MLDTRQPLAARARSQPIMSHGHADVRVRRAPCVCTDSILLLICSIYAAETQLDAAGHRPRARAATRRVVGVAQALLFGSPDVLRVLLAVVGGGLERVGALRGARVGQDGRLSVRAGRAWCQGSTWARLVPLVSVQGRVLTLVRKNVRSCGVQGCNTTTVIERSSSLLLPLARRWNSTDEKGY